MAVKEIPKADVELAEIKLLELVGDVPFVAEYYGHCLRGDNLRLNFEYLSGGDLYGIIDQTQPYFRSPLYASDVLRDVMLLARRRRPLVQLTDFVRVCRHLLTGLAALHACGVVHRDIKPENIRFSVDPRNNSYWGVKYIDFGLSCSTKTASGLLSCLNSSMGGTPRYQPHEYKPRSSLSTQEHLVAAHKRVNTGTLGMDMDVYSLGYVLFLFLSGQDHDVLYTRDNHKAVPFVNLVHTKTAEDESDYQKLLKLLDDMTRHSDRPSAKETLERFSVMFS